MLKFKDMNKALKDKMKVQVVVIAEDELLLLEFNRTDKIGFQNVTGSVEEDESFLEGARRELLEETGISCELVDLKKEFQFIDQYNFLVVEKIYFAHLKNKPTVKLSSEHKSFKWVKTFEITPKDYLYPSNFEAFQVTLERIKS